MINFEIIHNGKNSIRSYEKDRNVYECFAKTDHEETPICVCKISATENKWTISSWYTKSEYKNRGIGKQTLGYLLHYLYETYGIPETIEYIWDGTNEYVYNWMTKHFDAKCMCPLAVLKMNEAADDWLAHVYELNVEKVVQYFEMQQIKVM